MKVALENDFEKIRAHITQNDLNAHMSFGFVVRSRYGTLIALRAQLTEIFKDSFKYPQISNSPLYLVHWNDLCEAKKRQLETKR